MGYATGASKVGFNCPKMANYVQLDPFLTKSEEPVKADFFVFFWP